MGTISIVIPVYNESACLNALYDRLRKVEQDARVGFEYLFIDDGSQDGSREIIRRLAAGNPNVRYLFLSRNFGHEAATTAGLDHCSGDATIIIDSDLQDPPELIPELIAKWKEGYQVVYARRILRRGETFFKRTTSWLFYRILRGLSMVDIPADTGDFRLIDRSVVHQFRRCREQNRFVRGLVAWTGFRQTAVPYERDHRYAGQTKYSPLKLAGLAFDVMLGFSNLPLRLGILMGLLVCSICFGLIGIILIQKLFFGIPIPGYALLVTGVFFLGGIQLLITGLMAEYVGRIYQQVQARPLYIAAEKSPDLPSRETGWAESGAATKSDSN
jgi:glycosyltransferase involved in cell wall biosynthesis